MKIKIYIAVFLSVVFSPIEISLAQIPLDYKPPTPRTPELSNFMRYGEYDIDLFTGSPNISFTLFELNEYNLDIPIVLNYIGGGCKVGSSSSWVGLNWNLFPGGSITKSHVGYGSEKYNDNTYKALIQRPSYEQEFILSVPKLDKKGGIYGDVYEPNAYGWWDNTSPKMGTIATGEDYSFFDEVVAGAYFQPAIYSLNLLGYNCRFYIHPSTKEVVILNLKEFLKIEKKWV